MVLYSKGLMKVSLIDLAIPGIARISTSEKSVSFECTTSSTFLKFRTRLAAYWQALLLGFCLNLAHTTVLPSRQELTRSPPSSRPFQVSGRLSPGFSNAQFYPEEYLVHFSGIVCALCSLLLKTILSCATYRTASPFFNPY